MTTPLPAVEVFDAPQTTSEIMAEWSRSLTTMQRRIGHELEPSFLRLVDLLKVFVPASGLPSGALGADTTT